MVKRILGLRVALLLSLFKDKPTRIFRRIVGSIVLIAGAYTFAGAPLWMAKEDPSALNNIDNTFLLALAVAVFALPIFSPRWNLDLRSFSTYPQNSIQKAAALLLTGFMTAPFITVLGWAGFWVFLRKEYIENVSVTALYITAVIFLTFLTPRLTASLSKIIFDTERRRNIRNATGGLLLLAVFPVLAYFLFAFGSNNQKQHIGDIAEAIFLFSPISGLTGSLYSIHSLNQTLTISLSVLLVAAFALLTVLAMKREIETIPRPEASSVQEAKLGWFAAFPSNPQGAVGARSMIYWLKDPRYTVSLIAIPVIPFLVVAVLKFVGVSIDVLSFFPLPLVLILLAWMTHNDVSHDSTAFWLHVSSGLKGWQDRYGRITPVLMIGIPILLFGTGVSAVILGDWRLIPSFFGLGFAALSASLAVSSVSSVLVPYPATRPGESPFSQPQWHGAGAGFAQTSSFFASVVLTLPVVWVIAAWAKEPELNQQLLLALGSFLYGLTMLIFGIVVGGAIFNMRASDILSKAQVYD